MTTALHLTRDLPASDERLWAAFTTAELARWYWPERLAAAATLDVRPGGEYAVRSQSTELGFSGRYLSVDEPHGLSFTWRWDGEYAESTVSIVFSDGRLDLRHEGLADEETRVSHIEGWVSCLDRLALHLAV
ncbi:MAG: SRPBCC domain-containing protein [Hamadaea sp.]|uniref:SRPBCC family protein n=1 Tax=Hamadaea sp. TaxID=2024425 RepID=UPI0017B4441E|nr:SRPBCC family protein [Hamadaea sp.]NUR70539.1 SRPBCC domain-containing protein [Hamadaea sp.]NUT18146.1 SRPBCC domain-containing protein [Hamadaea sp.]